MLEILKPYWQFLKDNDVPNTVSLALPVLFGIVAYLFFKTKTRYIRGFYVNMSPGATAINGKMFHSVAFSFTNGTGFVVNLSEIYLRPRYKNFPVPPEAVKDVGGRGHEIKFNDGAGGLTLKEYVFQTNQAIETSIAILRPMPNKFYYHKASMLRFLFKVPKYYRLDYTAVVAQRKRRVAMIY